MLDRYGPSKEPRGTPVAATKGLVNSSANLTVESLHSGKIAPTPGQPRVNYTICFYFGDQNAIVTPVERLAAVQTNGINLKTFGEG